MKPETQALPTIEQFKEADRRACTRLIHRTIGLEDACEAYTELVAFQDNVVARLRGKVIGVCGLYRNGTEPDGWCGVGHFAVKPSWQGRGIGRRLLTWAKYTARRRGYTTLFVWSASNAIAFYRHFGFRNSHARGCGPAYSRHLMTKRLQW